MSHVEKSLFGVLVAAFGELTRECLSRLGFTFGGTERETGEKSRKNLDAVPTFKITHNDFFATFKKVSEELLFSFSNLINLCRSFEASLFLGMKGFFLRSSLTSQ